MLAQHKFIDHETGRVTSEIYVNLESIVYIKRDQEGNVMLLLNSGNLIDSTLGGTQSFWADLFWKKVQDSLIDINSKNKLENKPVSDTAHVNLGDANGNSKKDSKSSKKTN